MKPVLWHVVWLVLAAWAAADAQYSLKFSRSSSRTSWNPSFPSWSYSTPVRFSAVGDSTSKLTINASASMGFTLDDRSSGKSWQDKASGRSSISYPILGPKATIRLGASMNTSNSTLHKQKTRHQSFNFGFRSKPLSSGPFKNLSANLTPSLVTATRASRANLDSTIKETGIRYNASLRVSPEIEIAGKKLSNSISLSKTDDTLEHNKDRSERMSGNVSYTFPGEVRIGLNMSENRSQRGLTRAVISEDMAGEAVLRDTMISAELSETRGTSLSSSVEFDLGLFKIKNRASYSQNERTNTANAAQDLNNRFFGTDRLSENFSWDASLSGKLIEKLVVNTSVRFKGSDARRLAVRVLDTSRCDSHFTRSADGTCRDPSSDLSDRNFFLNGSLNWPLSDGHSLRLTTFGEIKRSENPGKPEQDRDTFNNSVSLSYDGTLRSGAKLGVDLKNSFLHRVNLHAKRAGDNSRNRDLSLNISTNYERLGASFSHSFSVSARRTIYDFDRQVNRRELSRESNIRRGWSMRHSLRRKILEALALNTRYEYKADDFGTLIAENGAQIVEEENAKHSVQFGMTYSASSDYSASASYSYRFDREWGYEYSMLAPSRFLNRRNTHRTLVATFNYNPVGSDNKLSLRGSRSHQRSGTFNSFSATYTRAL
ncbi:MAG: hypothetical protein OXH81_00085 [Gemmatimonadetes bacterium]|nr:hypothetical protein [Gemmatimonadota bacterium]MDE2734772.1 hypothetical protein [Gemmatimonadota bacterium]